MSVIHDISSVFCFTFSLNQIRHLAYRLNPHK